MTPADITPEEAVRAIKAWKGEPPYDSDAWQEDRRYGPAEEEYLAALAWLLTEFVAGRLRTETDE